MSVFRSIEVKCSAAVNKNRLLDWGLRFQMQKLTPNFRLHLENCLSYHL